MNILLVIDIEKYSSLQRLLAVTAYVLHFIDIARHLSHTVGHLTPLELSRAKLKWLQAIQHKAFPEEIVNLQSQSSIGAAVKTVLR